MFNYASLTKNGAALITRAINGEKFVFTRMEYGNGIPSEFNSSQTSEEIKSILFGRTSLVSKKADIGMYSISTKNNCATLTGKIISSSLTEDFLAKELGVFGKIGEEAEVLVAYFIATESPDPINQAALVGQEHKIIVDVATGNAADITIEYSPEIYATKEEFDALVASNAEEHAALEQAIADMVTSETITNIQQSITDEATARENADTALRQSITDEATARENADTALQQSIAALEASVDEKIGSIDISAALSHIKQYDFVVDSDETLLAWANCTDGSMKSVLVKSGKYTLRNKMINLVNAGTKFVFAEDGSKINVLSYIRGIGATEDYGAVVVGLNVMVNYTGDEECYAFYRGMICYNCTGTGTGNGNGNGNGTGTGFSNCTCYNCTGTGNGNDTNKGSNVTCTGTGFSNCTCYNCTGTGNGNGNGNGVTFNGYGFKNCTCSNCTGTGNGNGKGNGNGVTFNGYGFENCTCSNCTGTGTGNGYANSIPNANRSNGTGFSNCTCSNCTGTGIDKSGNISNSTGYGFKNCTCSNCTGTGTGTGTGYGFFSCKHCSSCRAGETASTTATWGGTNTYIDSDSCDYVVA